MLQIRLFGTFEVRMDGAPLPALKNRAGAELLALLTLRHDQDVRTTSVAETLWPDTGSLDNFRMLASRLRKALGEEGHRLEVHNQTVCLRLEGADVDLMAFEQAAMEALEEDVKALQQAVALYRGPLLEGWEAGWVYRERERYKEQYVDVLERLIAHCQRQANYPAAIRNLRRLLTQKPSRESVWCDLMETLLLAGERLEALELYRRYRDYLSQRHHLELPARMTALYTQLQERQTMPLPDLRPDLDDDDLTLESVGGAVPLRSRYYIVRATDREFHAALARQDSIVLVKGPRQIGKTSLLARGLAQARQEGARVVLTDFQKLGAADLETPESLFLAIAQSLALQLDLEAPTRERWNPALSPSANFERSLRRDILGQVAAPLIWAIDEADRLFSCAFRSDVFGLFRSWHNERALAPNSPWERLTLAIAYATEAHLFITDMNQSPFNVGTRLTLTDFTREQVEELNARYASPLSSEADIARLMALVGGHPYLVRCALHGLKTQQRTLDSIEAEADHEAGPFGEPLRRLLTALMQDAALTASVRSLLRGEPGLNSESFYRLHAAGLLVGDAPDRAAFRCHLYEQFLRRRLL
jgi:DNA-binding SARP family transcriptional activator